MSRILLVDDSPHAQRMGERILSEEGYEVVTVSNADSALIRLDDVDPDVVLADTVMPGRTGYEICQYLKMSPRHRHVRVILTAGVLETLRRGAGQARGGRWHAEEAVRSQRAAGGGQAAGRSGGGGAAAARTPARAPERPRQRQAAPVRRSWRWSMRNRCARRSRSRSTASMDAMVDEITRRVLAALADQKPRSAAASAAARAAPTAAVRRSRRRPPRL